MLLGRLVETSEQVGATRSRLAKTATLAAMLRELDTAEIAAAIGFITGAPRQQRLGVAWATAWRLEVPPATGCTITLSELDECFDLLATASGTGSQTARQRLIGDLFARATAPEQDFLRRLLVGDLRQGALAGSVAVAVAAATGVPAEQVRRAAMLSGDLAAAAHIALTDPAALADVGLVVGRAVEPMLASTATSVTDALGAPTRTCSVEWKLDGIRVQVHKQGDEVWVFTRNLNDITHRLDRLVETVRALPATSCILDGELIGLREDDAPMLFQHTASSVATEAGPRFSLTPFFFDIIHRDGVDLLDQPLHIRHLALAEVAGDHRIPTMVTDNPADAERFAREALSARHEGVVVKDIDSLYEAGRRGKPWRKVKPVRTLDLIVLGAEWGHGRRQGWLSNLHLGARDPNGGPPIMVGKTFKGLTDQLLGWQTAELQARAVSERGITVFVRPELVVEIAVDGIQQSTRYPGGVALRFARVKRYRPDRSATNADTIDAVRALG